MSQPILCPECGRSDTVEKVSTLYLTGIGLKGKAGEQLPAGGEPEQFGKRPRPGSFALSRKLAPPGGSPQGMTRPVHPDQVMIAVSAVLPIFLYGIWTSQKPFFLPVLGMMVIFYGLYLWQRKRLRVRFEQEQARRRTADERVKKGIERWMRLYYCSQDEIVFEPGKDEGIIVDLMPGYLLKE